jgi:hypothetical protein
VVVVVKGAGSTIGVEEVIGVEKTVEVLAVDDSAEVFLLVEVTGASLVAADKEVEEDV